MSQGSSLSMLIVIDRRSMKRTLLTVVKLVVHKKTEGCEILTISPYQLPFSSVYAFSYVNTELIVHMNKMTV
jgi:hypothetical protein